MAPSACTQGGPWPLLPTVHLQDGDTENLDWESQSGWLRLTGSSPYFIPKREQGTRDIQSGSQLTSEPAKKEESHNFMSTYCGLAELKDSLWIKRIQATCICDWKRGQGS